jgi:polysaccharide biosynthesis transport protein
MLQRNIDRPPPQMMNAGTGLNSEEAMSSLLRSISRNVRLIVVTALIGTTIAVTAVFLIRPQYKATVELLVDPRRTQLLKDREIVDGPGTENGVVESEAEMLTSPALLRRVAAKLDLVNDHEFNSVSLIGRIKALIPGAGKGGSDALAGVVAGLTKAVDAQRRGLTYVIELTVWSRDAAKAARLANTMAELYIADQVAAKRERAQQITNWLNDRVDELRKRVTASENAYEKYKAESGLFDPGGENLSDRQVEHLNEQLVQARAKAAEAQAKYEQLKQITPEKLKVAAANQDVLQSGVVSNLRGQYADAGKNAAEMQTRYGPQHPRVQIARAQLKDLSAQITEEISRIVASAKNEYEMAKSREDSLETSLNDLKQRAGEFNQAGVHLHELEREAQANRDLFQTFLSRAKETSAQLDMQLADTRIVSASSVPTKPAYPSRAPLIGLAFFGSLGLGIGVALARAALSKEVRGAEDIASVFGVYPLASLPLVKPRRRMLAITNQGRTLADMNFLRKTPASRDYQTVSLEHSGSGARFADIVLDQPDSPFAEGIRSLSLAVRRASSEGDARVALVTSALPGEGKSTVALNLARATAASGDRVLLIDADLRRPSLAAALGFGECRGLADILTGRSHPRESVCCDSRTGMYVIAGHAGLSGDHALALLSSGGMARLISMARDSFDHVVIDASPMLPIADTRRLVDYVDGVVMVVASEETPRQAISAALRDTPALEERLLGVVLNKAADDPHRHYYARSYTRNGDGRAAPMARSPSQ